MIKQRSEFNYYFCKTCDKPVDYCISNEYSNDHDYGITVYHCRECSGTTMEIRNVLDDIQHMIYLKNPNKGYVQEEIDKIKVRINERTI